ncbi:MAG: S8 family serine peptidase, partial [Thermoplasmata archaeon]
GTSLATPLVAGAVASILEKKSWLSMAEIKAILRQTAIDGGAVGPDNVWGHGRIQANQASNANPDMDLAWDDGFNVATAFSDYTVSDSGYVSLQSMRFHGTTMVDATDVPWVEAGGAGWIELDNSILIAGPYISEVSPTSITLTSTYDPGCLRMTFSVRLTELSPSEIKFEPFVNYNVCDQFSIRVNARFYLDFDIDGLAGDYFQSIGSSETHYTFDSSDEGFVKETNYPYSDVRWDSANGRVYVLSNRRDAGDEMFTHGIETLDGSTDFTVTARWRTTQQGNWQGAFPVFLAGQSNTQANQANSVYIYYRSMDSNLGQDPRYYMQYRDGTNTLRLNVYYTAQANTEYHLFIDYDASTQVLLLEVRDINDVTLASASYTIGTNPNDGFTFGKIGVSSDGFSSSSEPVTIAWTDDITLTSGAGSVYYAETRIQGTNLHVRDTSSSDRAEVYYRGSDNSPFEWLLRFPGSRDDPDGALTGQSIYSQNVVFVYESRKGSSRSGVIGPTVYLYT